MHSYDIKRGVLQDLVLRPLFWNISYDGLIRQKLSKGTIMVAFTGDVALDVVGKSIKEIKYFGDVLSKVVAS